MTKLVREVLPAGSGRRSAATSALLWTTFFVLWTIAVPLLIVLASGCCHTQPVKVVTEVHGCVTTPPPTPPAIQIDGPDEGCPDKYELCLVTPEAGKLWTYIQDLERWSANADANCKGDQPPSGRSTSTKDPVETEPPSA